MLQEHTFAAANFTLGPGSHPSAHPGPNTVRPCSVLAPTPCQPCLAPMPPMTKPQNATPWAADRAGTPV